MTALHDLPGTRLLALFARRELSPSEYYEHLLAHIQRWEPHLNALYRFDPQRIREQAAAATERWRKGQPKGPLDGLPVTIKELIATAGEPIPLAAPPPPCNPRPATRRRPLGCAKPARSSWPRLRFQTSACFHPASPASTESPAIPGTWPTIPAAPVRARQRRPPPATDRCTWAPTSAARCDCRRAGAAWWASSQASGGSPSTLTTPVAAPVR